MRTLALFLGFQLQKTSRLDCDRVLLHTSSICGNVLQALTRFWILKLVTDVQATGRLAWGDANIQYPGWSSKSFTKFHVLNLVDYDKVLLLDMDLVVLRCIGDLFQLPTPAAVCRSWFDMKKRTGRGLMAVSSSEEMLFLTKKAMIDFIGHGAKEEE